MVIYNVENNINGTVDVTVEVEEDDTSTVDQMRWFAMGAASAHTYRAVGTATLTGHYEGSYWFSCTVEWSA